MRLDEISGKDPAATELQDITNKLNESASRGYSFNAYNADKELATIIGRPPSMDIETQEGNLVEYIKRLVNSSQYWTFKAFRGDVEEEFACYVVRKDLTEDDGQPQQGIYKVYVNTHGDPEDSWATNAMEYDTVEEATAAANNLFDRWTAVKYWRVMDADKQTVYAEGP